jgi:hypothetical protein
MQGMAGVAVGAGVGVEATVGAAVGVGCVVNDAVWLGGAVVEAQPAMTLAAASAASGNSNRRIALERTR